MSEGGESILIVDDDEGMRVLLRRELEKSGHLVDVCHSGEEVLDWLIEHNPTLMLLDLGLPDMSGQDLLRRLEERGQKVPFIIVSGMSDLRVAVELMQGGALDFILKDASMLGLVGTVVERALKSLRVQRELDETQARLLNISESITDVFWMMDSKMEKFLYVSPAYEKIWGSPVSSLYENGSVWLEGVIEEDRSKIIRVTESLLQEYDSGFDEVYRIRNKLGEVRWIRGRAFTTRNEHGEVRYFSGVATDITDRKDLERQVVEATEHERIRIGQDLHDDLCQRLAALKLACGRTVDALAAKGLEEAESLRGIVDEIAEATRLSRSIAKGLSPVSLEAEGLMIALEDLAVMIADRFEISCRFDCPVPVEVSSPTCAAHVFRIAQELLNNAAKHAHPTRILVGLYQAAGGFKLEIVNDGVPFHGPKMKSEGMGLHFVKFRADAIGATLDFVPGKMPDGGTRVICAVPDLSSN